MPLAIYMLQAFDISYIHIYVLNTWQYKVLLRIYNPRQELLSHAFDLYSFWGVILDDTDFEVHWHLPMKRIDPRFIYVFFHQACQTGAYWAFDVCGGYANSFIAEARVDAWYPVQKLRATVVSKSHPKLFRSEISLDLVA